MRLRLPRGCARVDERIFEAATTRTTRFRAECGPAGLTGIVVEGLAEAGAEVVARVDGEVSLLSAEHPALDLSTPLSSPISFVTVGFEHVAFGLDHLLFLLGLAALARSSWRRLLGATMAFTLGHGLTLAAAALGAIQAPPRATEALIALTVLALAVELARRPGDGSADALQARGGPPTREARAAGFADLDAGGGSADAPQPKEDPSTREARATGFGAPGDAGRSADPVRPEGGPSTREARATGFGARERPWIFALACGLLHGLGFAGGLLELGLPPERALGALLGFNLGVELGQVAAMGAAIGVGALIARAAPDHTKIIYRSMVYTIGGVSAFWVISRSAAIMGWG